METQTSTQAPEYKSVEQKIEENILKPLGIGLYNLGRGFYSGAVSYFRFPTSIRKMMNDQSFINKMKEEGSFFNFFNHAMGGGIGFITPLFAGSPLLENGLFSLEDYFYTLLATNVVSGIYELGRLSRSRLEHKALKESKSMGKN